MKDKPFNPNWASPPGETIKETLEIRCISFPAFAIRMGLLLPDANKLINGELEITDEMADRLQDITNIDKQFWINREKNYRDKLKELSNE